MSSDDLRTRIAAVLNEAYPQGRYSRYHDAVARDLIRELGMRQQFLGESIGRPQSDTYRYVTEWTADE